MSSGEYDPSACSHFEKQTRAFCRYHQIRLRSDPGGFIFIQFDLCAGDFNCVIQRLEQDDAERRSSILHGVAVHFHQAVRSSENQHLDVRVERRAGAFVARRDRWEAFEIFPESHVKGSRFVL